MGLVWCSLVDVFCVLVWRMVVCCCDGCIARLVCWRICFLL